MLAEDTADWRRFQYSTYDNPFMDQAEVDAMRAQMPERVFRQEILAEFVEDGAYFQRVDDACTVGDHEPPAAHSGHFIAGGLDWAISNDYTVLTLACRDCNQAIYWDRFNNIDYGYQRARIIEACKRYNVRGLLPERNSMGQPNIEMLAAAGLVILSGPDGQPGFYTTATSKPALIQRLSAAIESGGLKAPRDYADELRTYEVDTMATGNPKFSAPSGMHDDRVISLALANWAVTSAAASLPDNDDLRQVSKWRSNEDDYTDPDYAYNSGGPAKGWTRKY